MGTRHIWLRAGWLMLVTLLLFSTVPDAHAATSTYKLTIKFAPRSITVTVSCRRSTSKRDHQPINLEAAILKPIGLPIPSVIITDPDGMPLPFITFTQPPTVGVATDVEQLHPAPPGFEWVQWESDPYAPPDFSATLDALLRFLFPPSTPTFLSPMGWVSDNGDELYGDLVEDGWGEAMAHHGLQIASTGSATLGMQSGMLVASDIGSSGEDGFTVVPGPSRGASLSLPGWDYGNIGQQLEQARVEVAGGVHGDPQGVFTLGLNMTQVMSGFDYTVDPPSGWTGPVASIWNQGTMVTEIPDVTTALLDQTPTEVEAGIKGSRGHDNLVVKLRYDVPFSGVMEGVPVSGDAIVLTYSAGLDLGAYVEEVRVRGTCAEENCTLSLDTVEGRWSGRLHHSRGAGLVIGQCVGPMCEGQSLVVGRIGSSGQDGVVIDVREGESSIMAEFPDPNPIAPLPDGSYLEMGARGSILGGPEEFLGSTRLTRNGASYELTADYSPIGSPTQTVMVFDGDQIVAEFPGLSGTLAQIPVLNAGCGKPWTIPWLTPQKAVNPLICFRWRWKNRQTFDIPGKAPVDGDALWVISEAAAAFGELYSISIQGSGVPLNEMTIRRETNGAPVDDLQVTALGSGMLEPGLLPTPGEASFLSTSDVSLVGISDSGEDGFSFPLDHVDRIHMNWEVVPVPGNIPTTPEATLRFEGPSMADPNQAAGVELHVQRPGSELLVDLDASEIDATDFGVVILDGNTVMLEQSGPAPASLGAMSLLICPEIMSWLTGGGISASIKFDDVVAITVDGAKTTVLGDRIVLTASGMTNGLTSLTAMRANLAGVSEVKLLSLSTTATTDGPPVATPRRMVLDPPRPNPFNPATNISFELDRAADVHLRIFSIAGRHVRTLRTGVLPAGRHAARWDGRDDAGRLVASGAYLVELATGTASLSQKITLLK